MDLQPGTTVQVKKVSAVFRYLGVEAVSKQRIGD